MGSVYIRRPYPCSAALSSDVVPLDSLKNKKATRLNLLLKKLNIHLGLA